MAIVVEHPVLSDSLARLRDRRTGTEEFRRLMRLAAILLCAEALRDLPLRRARIRTPLAPAEGGIIAGPPPVAVPVLRAGLGLLPGLLDLVPGAAVGVIGLRRNERTFEAGEYCRSLPRPLAGRAVVILDPMLATGGSLAAAIGVVKEHGADDIRAVTLLAAPEGVRFVRRRHPGIRVFTGAVDERLDENAYIIPGIGDAGDRLFGSK